MNIIIDTLNVLKILHKFKESFAELNRQHKKIPKNQSISQNFGIEWYIKELLNSRNQVKGLTI